MPVILTATDYSDIANRAVHYACNMALAYGASVTVVHSFIIPVVISTDTPMPAISIEEAREMSVEKMNDLINTLKAQYPNLDINSHITYGDIVDSLQEYTETAKPWLIVIGNSSSEDTNFWPGSNLINALKDLPYPVLAVPAEANYTPVQNICFACDFKNTSEQLPEQELIDIAQKTGAKLHVLNIYKESESQESVFGESDKLKDALSTISAEFHFIGSDNTDDEIQNFITENNMDWLAIIPHKHGFFEGLLHRSHTKAMARTSHIPLMALHAKTS